MTALILLSTRCCSGVLLFSHTDCCHHTAASHCCPHTAVITLLPSHCCPHIAVLTLLSSHCCSGQANTALLSSQLFEPIRHVAALPALSVHALVSGDNQVQVFDFGQNLAGVVRIQLEAGQCTANNSITIRHAEVLLHPPYGPANGSIYTGNLRGAKATDIYTCDGNANTLVPTFTQHGFRYAEVTGVTLALDQIVALEMHTDVRQHSDVTFSNNLLNQIQHAVVWSQKSNLMSVPIDCPNRDERKGWMGE